MNKTLKCVLRNTLIISSLYLLGNTPEFIRTYTLPQEKIKPSLSEQLNFEMNQLEDISGGATFANFRMLGICAGYEARKLLK